MSDVWSEFRWALMCWGALAGIVVCAVGYWPLVFALLRAWDVPAFRARWGTVLARVGTAPHHCRHHWYDHVHDLAWCTPRRGRVRRSLPPYGTGDVCLRLLGRQHALLHVSYGAPSRTPEIATRS